MVDGYAGYVRWISDADVAGDRSLRGSVHNRLAYISVLMSFRT